MEAAAPPSSPAYHAADSAEGENRAALVLPVITYNAWEGRRPLGARVGRSRAPPYPRMSPPHPGLWRGTETPGCRNRLSQGVELPRSLRQSRLAAVPRAGALGMAPSMAG
jgi:hypothetical protein